MHQTLKSKTFKRRTICHLTYGFSFHIKISAWRKGQRPKFSSELVNNFVSAIKLLHLQGSTYCSSAELCRFATFHNDIGLKCGRLYPLSLNAASNIYQGREPIVL